MDKKKLNAAKLERDSLKHFPLAGRKCVCEGVGYERVCLGRRRRRLWPSEERVKKGGERLGKRIIGEISCVCGWNVEHCVW